MSTPKQLAKDIVWSILEVQSNPALGFEDAVAAVLKLLYDPLQANAQVVKYMMDHKIDFTDVKPEEILATILEHANELQLQAWSVVNDVTKT